MKIKHIDLLSNRAIGGKLPHSHLEINMSGEGATSASVLSIARS